VAEKDYGLPVYTPELERAVEEGKNIFGGCMSMPSDPFFYTKM